MIIQLVHKYADFQFFTMNLCKINALILGKTIDAKLKFSLVWRIKITKWYLLLGATANQRIVTQWLWFWSAQDQTKVLCTRKNQLIIIIVILVIHIVVKAERNVSSNHACILSERKTNQTIQFFRSEFALFVKS